MYEMTWVNYCERKMIMKRIFALTLISASLLSVTAAAAEFSDIRGHWAEASINSLAERNIVNGVTDTEFMPDGVVTRAQYLKMIMEATGIKTVEYRYEECLDATASDWYAPYLQAALDAGLVPSNMITGYSADVTYEVDDTGKATSSKVIYHGAFNGNLPITREEMAVLTQYCYQYTRTVLTDDRQEVDVNIANSFSDGDDISDWAKASVSQAVNNRFIEGMDDGTFKPKETATRAQAATIILRVLNS